MHSVFQLILYVGAQLDVAWFGEEIEGAGGIAAYLQWDDVVLFVILHIEIAIEVIPRVQLIVLELVGVGDGRSDCRGPT